MNYVKSDLTDLAHGFFTRDGGVSKGAFATLNVKNGIGDNDENVDQNRFRCARLLDLNAKNLVFLNDLDHSNKIAVADLFDAGSEINGYDGVITLDKDVAVGLSVADCLPIIFTDQKGSFAGVIHAGWRGLKNGVIEAMTDKIITGFGIKAKDVIAIIGPSVAPESYEVKNDVAVQFNQKYIHVDNVIITLDMWAIAEDKLKKAGIQQIDNLKINTMVDERFYSYRRSKTETGRFMAMISL